jgi:PAS domain S-box-containing protein
LKIDTLSYLKTLTVLYVDPSSEYKDFLEKSFKEVYSLSDGVDALNIFEEKMFNGEKVDLIITDLKLNSMGGLDLIRKIKLYTPSIPVFILTKDKSNTNIINALKLKVTNYLFKPIEDNEFMQTIHAACLPIHEEKIILHQKEQLEQYIEIVNQVALISKTNSKGIITEVNDIFCDVAGYTREELIGQPHNIIRHNDMPKDAFKEMWETISSGKVWKGKVKNKKKDGDSYSVNSTIFPIFEDDEENIKEYMAVRFLTTEDDAKHREFKSQVMAQVKEARLKEVDYKKEIKELNERLKMFEDQEYLMEAYDREKKKTDKLLTQVSYYEKEKVDIAAKNKKVLLQMKDKLLESIKASREGEIKSKRLSTAVIELKKQNEDLKKEVDRILNEYGKMRKKADDYHDVIVNQDHVLKEQGLMLKGK